MLLEKYIKSLIFAVVLIVAIGFVYFQFIKERNPIIREIVKYDTVYKLISANPHVLQAKAKIIYRNIKVPVSKDVNCDSLIAMARESGTKDIDSSLYITKPFIASVDTIIKADTISMNYKFPENKFDLLVKHHPDSIATIIETKIITKEPAWYETAAYIVGGAFTGYLIGRIK